MKRLAASLLVIGMIISGVAVSNAEGVRSTAVGKISDKSLNEQKIYSIPTKLQKVHYSIEDFKQLLPRYEKINGVKAASTKENDKTGMAKEDKIKYYTTAETTPAEVKNEIGCQIFKVNNSCETFVIYKAKLFKIGFGFGGLGVVNIATCDFDGDGQKDLLYTFSWGSGLHRSQIGLFNMLKMKENWLDFYLISKDIILKKINDKQFGVYIAETTNMKNMDFIDIKLSMKEHVADVKSNSGKIQVVKPK